MRLIDAGTVTRKGEELIARFVIGGREVSYKIRSAHPTIRCSCRHSATSNARWRFERGAEAAASAGRVSKFWR